MPTIRSLQAEDLESLRALFRSFPHKKPQHRFQGIDSDALADYFTQAEHRHVDAADRFVGLEDDRVTAFGGVQSDDWHSQFYPFRFGRLAPLLLHNASPDLSGRMIDALLAAAREAGLQHLSARIDGSEYDLLRRLQERDFYLVDCSVKMCAPLSRVPSLAPPSGAGGMTIREYRPDDLAVVKEIAATSHSVNHFFNDPYLGRAQTNQLFEGWVEKCCGGASSIAHVVERHDRPCGFIIYLNPAGFNKAMGTRLVILDFVCLARAAQGGGVGRWFISQTLRKLGESFDQVELRTSQNNYAALGCYENLGMQIISSDFIAHRHDA